MPDKPNVSRRDQRRFRYHNDVAHRRRTIAAIKSRRHRLRDNVRQYLSSHPCVDCGENRIDTLDFDHVRGVKIQTVCAMVQRGREWEIIEQEIAKCEVRCGNCHRIRTSRQFGWGQSENRQAENGLLLAEYKRQNGCINCGEDRSEALDFNHVRGRKVMNISSMARCASWKRIALEIAKCEILCRNCHRLQHAES